MKNYVNAGRWFSILYRRSQQYIVEACQRMGLTFSEFTVLMRIHANPGVKHDDLAKVLFLDKAVVTRTINSLEQKGYIVRSQDKLDKRVKHVYLSVEAESYYPFLHNVLKTWMDYLCEGMSEKELEKMNKFFQHLTDRACEANLPELAKDISEEFTEEDWQHDQESRQ
jgi:DNA-binding MarR family transcriptional regulator